MGLAGCAEIKQEKKLLAINTAHCRVAISKNFSVGHIKGANEHNIPLFLTDDFTLESIIFTVLKCGELLTP